MRRHGPTAPGGFRSARTLLGGVGRSEPWRNGPASPGRLSSAWTFRRSGQVPLLWLLRCAGTWPLPRNVRAELSPSGEAGPCRRSSDRPTPPRSVRAERNPPGAVGPCRRTRATETQIAGRRRGTSEPSGARRERLDRAGAPEPPRLRPPGRRRGTSEPSRARRERLDRAGALAPPRLRSPDADEESPCRAEPAGRGCAVPAHSSRRG